MALLRCPKCGNSISDKALSCPNCSYDIRRALERERLERKVIRKNKNQKLMKNIGKFLRINILLFVIIACFKIYYKCYYLPNIEKNVLKAVEEYVEGEEIAKLLKKIEDAMKLENSNARNQKATQLLRENLLIYVNNMVECKEFEEAYELIKRVEDDFGSTEEIGMQKRTIHGLITFSNKNYETAVKIFEKANYKGEEYLESCYQEALVYINMDLKSVAKKFLEKIVVYNYKDSVELLEKMK